MRLYLIRHAESAPGEPDALRPLTREGRKQARELAARLAAEPVRPGVVLTSPLLRARQTGEEVARATGALTEPDDRLEPGATTARVREAIAGRGEHVVVVGHQPDCGRIAAELTGRPEPAFPAAGMVVIDL